MLSWYILVGVGGGAETDNYLINNLASGYKYLQMNKAGRVRGC